jgi:hypothetical protein
MDTDQQSPEELLRQWRLRQQREYDATVKALREAIADMEDGDTGKPFDEFLDEFRQKHHIPHAV